MFPIAIENKRRKSQKMKSLTPEWWVWGGWRVGVKV